eukprot:211522_1
MTSCSQELLVNGYIRLTSNPYYIPNDIIKLCLLWFMPIKTIKYTLNQHTFVIFEHLQLTKIIKQSAYWKRLNVIAEVKHKKSDRLYAIKKYCCSETNLKPLWKEIKLLMHFNHPNVMKILDVIPIESDKKTQFNNIYILMYRMDVNMEKVIRSKQILTERHIQYIIYQMLRGLDYIHKCGVIHTTLCPKHILINASDCKLRITGLENAIRMNTKADSFADNAYGNNRLYESFDIQLVGLDFIIDEKFDQWSVGVIAAELYIGRDKLFNGRNMTQRLKSLLILEDMDWIISPAKIRFGLDKNTLELQKREGLNKVLIGCSELGCEFIKSLLLLNPVKRMSVENAMDHEWLKEFNNHKYARKKFNISLFNFRSFELMDNLQIKQVIYDEINCFYQIAPQKNWRRSLFKCF